EDAIKNLLLLLDLWAFEGRANPVTFIFDGSNCGVEEDRVEHFCQPLMQRSNKISVRSGKQPGQHFNDRHARGERSIYRTQLQSDVAAAHHEQAAWNMFEVEGTC